MKKIKVQSASSRAVGDLEVPDDAVFTFGPFSPPTKDSGTYRNLAGTLRVYKGKVSTATIIGVFTDVAGFYDESQLKLTTPKEAEPLKLTTKKPQKASYLTGVINPSGVLSFDVDSPVKMALYNDAHPPLALCAHCGEYKAQPLSTYCPECLKDEEGLGNGTV